MKMHQIKLFGRITSSAVPDQTTPYQAVWSGVTLFSQILMVSMAGLKDMMKKRYDDMLNCEHQDRYL